MQETGIQTRRPLVTAHYVDVSDVSSVKTCLDEILARHRHVDGLVTSAGFTENFPATEYPPDRMRRLWAVNVDGTYFWASEVAKHLMVTKKSGSMVFIGSMSGAIVNVPQPQTLVFSHSVCLTPPQKKTKKKHSRCLSGCFISFLVPACPFERRGAHM
jgi:NAD(P)-dependent dehydrogenase (short-subunit alcohol dehydrogenase family)